MSPLLPLAFQGHQADRCSRVVTEKDFVLVVKTSLLHSREPYRCRENCTVTDLMLARCKRFCVFVGLAQSRS